MVGLAKVAFWGLWSIAAVAAGVVLWFFVVGLDGSVSSFNIVLWLGILSAAAIIVGEVSGFAPKRRPA